MTYRIHAGEKTMYVRASNAKLVQVGEYCRVAGEAVIPRSYQNPGSFQYEQYLVWQRVDGYMHEATFTDCQKVSTPRIVQIHDSLKQWRVECIAQLLQTVPSPLNSYAIALVFGSDDAFTDEIINFYTLTGTIHLLAISGAQFVLLAWVVNRLLARLYVPETIRAVVVCVSAIGYAIMAGAEVSVVRACFMIILYVVFVRLGVSRPSLLVWMLVFYSMAFLQPFQLLHVGFQFSYIAVLVLLLSRELFVKQKGTVRGALFVSAVVSVLIAPISWITFHQFHPLGMLYNTLLSPIFLFFLQPFAWFSFLFQRFGHTLFFTCLNDFIILFHHALRSTQTIMNSEPIKIGPFVFTLVLTSFVCVFVVISKMNATVQLCVVIVLAFVSPILVSTSTRLVSEGQVIFIDVGQGDSTLIITPGTKEVVLIDTGGRIGLGEQVSEEEQKKHFEATVSPVLRYYGIRKIDLLVLTHDDGDHVGSAQALLNDWPVLSVWVPKYRTDETWLKPIMQQAKKQNIAVNEVATGKQISLGDVQLHVLLPFQREANDNEGSIVLYGVIGGERWLFPGDLGEEGEEKLRAQFPNLKVDVLKVGHHGSKTSTSASFLRQIQP
ncbi:MAG: DNA internalization-related competence protein ComEC/Rec2, partial [Bacilli bacterium]